MRFSQLFDQEAPTYKNKISGTYQKFQRSRHYQAKESNDWLFELFGSLSEDLRNKYFDAVRKFYSLSPSEFKSVFEDDGGAIRNSGLFMFCTQANCFFSPEEFIEALLPDELPGILIGLNKKSIQESVSEDLKTARKEDLIKEIVRNHAVIYSYVCEGNKEDILKKIFDLEWPFSHLLEHRVSIYDYNSEGILRTLAGGDKTYSKDFVELPRKCREVYGELLTKGVLFYSNKSNTISLEMNPLVKKWYLENKNKALQAKLAGLISAPEPLLTKEPIAFHVEAQVLKRKALFLASAILNHEIEFTVDANLKRGDISKFAKSYAPKDILPSEQKALIEIGNIFFRNQVFKFSPLSSRMELDREKLLKVGPSVIESSAISAFGLDIKKGREIFSSFQTGKWIQFKTFLQAFGLAYGHTRPAENPAIAGNLAFVLCFFAGEADLALDGEKNNWIVAIRRVEKAQNSASHDIPKINMQSNLEVPIPLQIKDNVLLDLLELLSVKSLYSLTLDVKAINRMQVRGVNAASYIARLENLFDGSLPNTAKSLIENTLVVQSPVRILDTGIPVLVASDAQASLVRQNFKGKIAGEFFNRLFLIKADRFSRIETKLKSLGLSLSLDSKTLESERVDGAMLN
jgi:hypothetical protein